MNLCARICSLTAVAGALLGCGSGSHVSSGETSATCPPDSSVDYEGFVRPFMDEYCTRCHASTLPASERHGAPRDHNFDSLDGILDELDHVAEAAAAGPDAVNTAMPPSAPRPTRAEREQLGEWIACQLASGGASN